MAPEETEQQRISYVRVTNNMPFAFKDRHDGVPVTIPPGSSENIPPDMAAHFFGYSYGVEPEVMFRHICKRQGWNTPEYVKQNPETHKTLAQEYFDKLKIEAKAYKLVPVDEPDPKKPVPADPQIPAELDASIRRPRPTRQPQETA